jgi:CRP/FNR family transcriptional regulator
MEGERQRPLIISLLAPLEMNISPGMFVDMRHHASLMALSDTGACFMEIAAFRAIMRQNKSFEEAFLKEYSTRVLHALRHFSVITQKNMEGRIAEALLYLQKDVFGGNPIRHVTKQDFADLTAMTRESAIRVMKDLKKSGLIEEDRDRITVMDTTGLERIAMNA